MQGLLNWWWGWSIGWNEFCQLEYSSTVFTRTLRSIRRENLIFVLHSRQRVPLRLCSSVAERMQLCTQRHSGWADGRLPSGASSTLLAPVFAWPRRSSHLEMIRLFLLLAIVGFALCQVSWHVGWHQPPHNISFLRDWWHPCWSKFQLLLESAKLEGSWQYHNAKTLVRKLMLKSKTNFKEKPLITYDKTHLQEKPRLGNDGRPLLNKPKLDLCKKRLAPIWKLTKLDLKIVQIANNFL